MVKFQTTRKYLLPHSAPSWILSYAENLASLSLQDRASIGTVITERASKPPSMNIFLIYLFSV